MFELGRRHKIMKLDKMRTIYREARLFAAGVSVYRVHDVRVDTSCSTAGRRRFANCLSSLTSRRSGWRTNFSMQTGCLTCCATPSSRLPRKRPSRRSGADEIFSATSEPKNRDRDTLSQVPPNRDRQVGDGGAGIVQHRNNHALSRALSRQDLGDDTGDDPGDAGVLQDTCPCMLPCLIFWKPKVAG